MRRPPKPAPALPALCLFASAMTSAASAQCPARFGPPTSIAVPSTWGHRLIVADFDNDGRPDLAAGTVGHESGPTAILMNRGGAFELTWVVNTTTYMVATGDFNNDGMTDLVESEIGGVYIQLGHADGTFAPAVFRTLGQPIDLQFVTVSDFNADGRADLALTNHNLGRVVVALGNGDGTFQPPAVYSVPTLPTAALAADLNGDGRPDLVIAASNSVKVMLGNGDGTFAPAASFDVGYSDQLTSLAAADFDSDGHTDIVAGGSGVYVLLGNGDGTLRPPAPTPIFTYTTRNFVSAADLDGDGHPDVIFAAAGDTFVHTLMGNGDGTFGPLALAAASPSFFYGALAIADVNADGRPDLIATNYGGPLSVAVHLNAAGSADFNNDGDPATDADIEAFFACIAGNCCPTCDSPDLDGDGVPGTDADIQSFFRVLAGESC